MSETNSEPNNSAGSNDEIDCISERLQHHADDSNNKDERFNKIEGNEHFIPSSENSNEVEDENCDSDESVNSVTEENNQLSLLMSDSEADEKNNPKKRRHSTSQTKNCKKQNLGEVEGQYLDITEDSQSSTVLECSVDASEEITSVTNDDKEGTETFSKNNQDIADAEKALQLKQERLRKMQESFQRFLATSINGSDGKKLSESSESVNKADGNTEDIKEEPINNDRPGNSNYLHAEVTGVQTNSISVKHSHVGNRNAYQWRDVKKQQFNPRPEQLPPGSILLTDEVKRQLFAAQKVLGNSVVMKFPFLENASDSASDGGFSRGWDSRRNWHTNTEYSRQSSGHWTNQRNNSKGDEGSGINYLYDY